MCSGTKAEVVRQRIENQKHKNAVRGIRPCDFKLPKIHVQKQKTKRSKSSQLPAGNLSQQRHKLVYEQLQKSFHASGSRKQIPGGVGGPWKAPKKRKGQRLWGVESSSGLLCDSVVQTDLTCFDTPQLHLESTDTDESSKLLLSGELPRRHWAFQGPEMDEVDWTRNLRQPAQKRFYKNVSTLCQTEDLDNLEDLKPVDSVQQNPEAQAQPQPETRTQTTLTDYLL